MQTAEVVLSVLRDRGGKGLPCTQLYRQMFNKDLYLLASDVWKLNRLERAAKTSMLKTLGAP